ncbi:hypothetical protein PYCCODRAFT_47492 [Trametes coccinea BRFM310]|uniref:Uncharacterized protein n=1 Tax=Trametes coccinea (strain BRFM310) TaxID=1353009 RepID=A0A1Y2J8A7_TRAC3|nr:hypothetical protein PYCCODRAFT_47492 [Trametes coccinea BRFM310]
MDWWSLFRKEWPHSSVLQRAIILTLIGVNAFTSLLLYLMIVVVFRMWKELLRMLFLLCIHIAPAVLFTLYGITFSCQIFVLGYTVYLCIMSRVPRPFPLITPNDLLDTPIRTRPFSTTSIRSTTGLLSRPDYRPPMRSASPASVYSHRSAGTRTVPKKQFVANTGGKSHVDERSRLGPFYGTTTAQDERSPSQSRFSMSTIGSVEDDSPMSPLKKLIKLRTPQHSRNPSAASQPQIVQHQPPPRPPPRPLLLNPNSFRDPLSRDGTPETAFSGSTFVSRPGSVNTAHMAPGPFVHRGYTNPFMQYMTGVPAQTQLQSGSQAYVSGNASPYVGPQTHHAVPTSYYPGAPVTPQKAHSANSSASSIHSMAPSIHFTDASGHTYVHPAVLTPSHPSNGNAAAHFPPVAHLRSANNPFFRSYSTEPRVRTLDVNDDVALPNHYARVGEIRRYGSVPHVRSGSFAGYDPYVAHRQGDNAGAGAQLKDIEYGVRAPYDRSWMEAVMKAAWQG